MSNSKAVCVIGAGLAGLACARVLQATGWHVTVLDKSRGPAGRMSTRRGEGWQCDHGARYFTARDPRFINEVTAWQGAGVVAPWTPRLAVMGDDENETADVPPVRYVGVPRMTAPARYLADALPVQLQQTVQAIVPNLAGWSVHTLESGALAQAFSAVVLAVPAPQAQPLLASVAPELAMLAAQVRMTGTWTLMVRYAMPLDLPFDAAFVNRGALRWVAREASKPGRPQSETWLLQASTAWSESHIEAEPERVAEALLAAFRDLGAPAPVAWTAHRWRYADTAMPLGCTYRWSAEQGIGLCGDWLADGRVEGAWLSGTRLAEAMGGALSCQGMGVTAIASGGATPEAEQSVKSHAL